MKVIIEGRAEFDGHVDFEEVPLEIVGPPHADHDDWAVLIVHHKVTLVVEPNELYRALRPFLKD